MSASDIGPGDYIDYGFTDDSPLGHAGIVFPAVIALSRTLPDDARVLDIGCGNGNLSGLFLERGHRVVGVDLSEQGVEIAQARHPDARFEVMPADDRVLERLGEEPFDLVVSTEVVEHLYAPQRFLEGCYEALRPGGQMIISTPYHGYLKNLLIAATGKFDQHVQARSQGGHIKFWSRATIHEAMREAGFQDFDFRGVGRIPLLWKSMVVAGRRPDG